MSEQLSRGFFQDPSAGTDHYTAHLLTQIATLSEHEQKLTENLRMTKIEVKQQAQKTSDLEAYVQRYDEELSVRSRKCESLVRQSRDLRASKQHLEEIVTQLNRQNDSLSRENETLAQSHKTFARENEKLTQQNETLLQECQAITEELERRSKALEQLGNENAMLGRELEILKSELLSCTNNLDELRGVSTISPDLGCHGQIGDYDSHNEPTGFVSNIKSPVELRTLQEELESLVDGSCSESGSDCSEVACGTEQHLGQTDGNTAGFRSTIQPGHVMHPIRRSQRVLEASEDTSVELTSPKPLGEQRRTRSSKRARGTPHQVYSLQGHTRSAATQKVEDLNSLHGHADQGMFLTVAAIVDRRLGETQSSGKEEYLLTDEGRCGRKAVRIIFDPSARCRGPEAHTGDAMILRHVAVRYNTKKIPYMHTVKKSTWCLMDTHGDLRCSRADCYIFQDDRSRLHQLRIWWCEGVEKQDGSGGRRYCG